MKKIISLIFIVSLFLLKTTAFAQSNISQTDYFESDKIPNQQLHISDIGFDQKFGVNNPFGFVRIIFAVIGPIYLILFIFWIWMIIDCAGREFDDKVIWILLLIFLNFLGAILYYFNIKRKNISSKPPEFIA